MSWASWEFTPTVSSYADTNAANAALEAATGFNFTGKIDGIEYSWHHHQNGRTMMLIPSSINLGAAHIGGKSLAQKELWDLFPGPDEIADYLKGCQ